MSRTIKTLAVAALVAVSASSAFAATVHHRARTSSYEQYNNQLIEGRNAAPQWGYSSGATSTSRNAMVQELGNWVRALFPRVQNDRPLRPVIYLRLSSRCEADTKDELIGGARAVATAISWSQVVRDRPASASQILVCVFGSTVAADLERLIEVALRGRDVSFVA
jgi:hypothetical protein